MGGRSAGLQWTAFRKRSRLVDTSADVPSFFDVKFFIISGELVTVFICANRKAGVVQHLPVSWQGLCISCFATPQNAVSGQKRESEFQPERGVIEKASLRTALGGPNVAGATIRFVLGAKRLRCFKAFVGGIWRGDPRRIMEG